MTTTQVADTDRPPFFERLEAGLNEILAHVQGEAHLKTHTLTLPDPPPAYTAERVRELRARLRLSQSYFSTLLNVSPKTVQSWEQGARVPSHAAARLLQLIEDPDALASLSQTGK